MKPRQDEGFRIYIVDRRTKLYLREWIVCEGRDHILFDTDRRYAKQFKRLEKAKECKQRMIALKYHPRIE